MENLRQHFDKEIDLIVQKVHARKMIQTGWNGLQAADELDRDKNKKRAEALRIVSLDILMEGIIEFGKIGN